MIKTILISLISLIGLFVNYLYTNEVNLYAMYPAEVKAGESFDVQITVEKGNLSEFGRYTQELPIGFTATSENKLFSFSENKVKFLWISMPAGSSYTFSYTINVPDIITGENTLGGQFAYIMNNEKQVSTLPPFSITIKPNNTPESEINRNENYASNSANIAPNETQVFANRKIKPVNGAYIVKINVNKGQLAGMAKVTEQIPQGYTAESVESMNGVFTQEGNVAKFLWMNMANESDFTISYLLTKQNPSSNGDPVIEGNFSYSSSGITKTVQIINDSNIAELNQNEIASAQKQVALPKESYITNVTYKVQIAAGHKIVNTKTYFKKFNILEKVTVIQHDGWHKYTIGKFSDYKSARDHRTEIWQNSLAKDAFVAAYNAEDRITVQEALMIASHKWYQ